jgi:ATP-binding cassette subfamily B (MDR/TAP) protein 1
VGWFDEEKNNSNLVSARLATDATLVKAAVGDRMSTIMQNLALVITAFCIAFYLQWKVAGIILLTFPLLIGSAVGEVCHISIGIIIYTYLHVHNLRCS